MLALLFMLFVAIIGMNIVSLNNVSSDRMSSDRMSSDSMSLNNVRAATKHELSNADYKELLREISELQTASASCNIELCRDALGVKINYAHKRLNDDTMTRVRGMSRSM